VWEAVAAAIVRQVIRTEQARRLYRRFSDAFGDRVALPRRRLAWGARHGGRR